MWTWKTGSLTPNPKGVYGTPGQFQETNTPGGRWDSAFWTDEDGDFWLWGGYGYDVSSATRSVHFFV